MQFNSSKDPFKWVAHYRNGKSLAQINEDGSVNAYGDIDRSQLDSFEMVRKSDGSRAMLVKFEPGQQLIWRRRVDIIEGKCVHIIGKRDSERRWIAVLYPDDSVEFAEKWDDNHPWLYPPQPHLNEGEEDV